MHVPFDCGCGFEILQTQIKYGTFLLHNCVVFAVVVVASGGVRMMMSDLQRSRDLCWACSAAETSMGTRGFVITGSEDGGSVVVVGICPRMVYFHLCPVGK